MRNKFLYYLVILLASLTVLSPAFADTEEGGTITSDADGIVDISIDLTHTSAMTMIHPSTGNLINSLLVTFIAVNNNDQDKDLRLTIDCNTKDGTTSSAFGDEFSQNVILTNNSDLPGISSVNDIKSSPGSPINNPNAIGYYITNGATLGMHLIDFKDSSWDLSLDHNSTGYLTTIINSPPYSNSFGTDNDIAGNYQATLTLSLFGS